jgi:Dolichyl-phosphate-mannose-protein mannosyltransferase
VTRSRTLVPSGAVGKVLLGLLFAGLLLRLVAILSWWPTTTTLDDGYQLFATNPFEDRQHPAGYGLILGALGTVTHEVAIPVLIQHMSGMASALLLFAATRRVTGSAWPALAPAAVVLLNPDQIFLEHAIMSESWAVLTTSIALYAAVRTLDEPRPLWRWPMVCGVALAVAVTIRTAALLMIPVVLLAIAFSRAPPAGSRRAAPLVAAVGAAVILGAFALANAGLGHGFGLGPSSGWYLYGRVAQFADCRHFTPPAGTRALCEYRRPDERPGASYYLFDADAPAPRTIGAFGDRDDLVGEWAGRALRAQPDDFVSAAWEYLRGYWVPGLRPNRPDSGMELDPQLDFTSDNPFFKPVIEQNLEAFYNDFTVDAYQPGRELLHGWQRVGRFGAVALCLTTLLTLIGLAVGTRRSRVGVLLFGVGGLALIVAPALTGNYVGRYVVPMAGPLVAAAAITVFQLLRPAAHPSPGRGAPDLARAAN